MSNYNSKLWTYKGKEIAKDKNFWTADITWGNCRHLSSGIKACENTHGNAVSRLAPHSHSRVLLPVAALSQGNARTFRGLQI